MPFSSPSPHLPARENLGPRASLTSLRSILQTRARSFRHIWYLTSGCGIDPQLKKRDGVKSSGRLVVLGEGGESLALLHPGVLELVAEFQDGD
jgi:hypothetical protein